MKKFPFVFLVISMLFACTHSKDNSLSLKNPSILPSYNNGGIILPENFAATVVVDTLSRGRHLIVNDNGDIFAHLARPFNGFGIVALRDNNGDGRADTIVGFKEYTGTGIEIHKEHLYYSTRDRVYRSPLVEGQLLPSQEMDTIAHLLGTRGHSEKPFAFDNAGNMYVNVGSLSNACEQPLRTGNSPGEDPCTELETRGGIWQFKDDVSGQKQEEAKRYATGIRNAVAITWDNASNSLYVAQHGRDDLHRYWPELFTEAENVELPAEEFFQVGENDDFGWPYCYYNHFDNQKYLNPEYGGDGKLIGRCEDVKNPVASFPAHWGPNDVIFYKGDQFPEKYKNGAFIAFHGSWNRLNSDQEGYRVVFVPMKDGKATGPWENFANGFIGAPAIQNPGSAKYRPCGLAEGPDGSLYVIDSQKGRIWRIMHYPEGVPTVEPDGTSEEQVASAEILPDSPGKSLYDQHCRACHQANAKGAPGMIPPLTGTDWVTGDKDRLINVILKGLNETIEINGETYQNAMPAMNYLSDGDIAQILTFVRSNFGNDASAILADDVKALR